jgi:hypothetical protein
MGIFNIIIVIILIIVVIWGLRNLFFKTNIIYDVMCDAAKPVALESSVSSLFVTKSNIIMAQDIPENSSSNFTLSVWFYIDNWGNNISNEKNVLYMAVDSSAPTVPELASMLSGLSTKVEKDISLNQVKPKNLNIALDKYENNLLIDIETYLDKNTSSGTSSSLATKRNYTRYKIPNIPVQKWNNLTLSIDTRTLDVYLDGKLRNSFIMHGLYKNFYSTTERKNIYIGNMSQGANSANNNGVNSGFEGFITRIRYENDSINPQEAYNIYKEGIDKSLAKSMFNKYRLKVSFLEYDKVKGSFEI